MSHSAIRRMLRLFCAMLCFMLAACTGKSPVVPTDSQLPAERYGNLTQSFDNGPFRISFSVRAGIMRNGFSDTRRVTGIIWGNETGPIRMDISAGIGISIFHAREDERQLIWYLPSEETLYTVPTAAYNNLYQLGITLPFTLRDLAELARGNFGSVFPLESAAAKSNADTKNITLALTDDAHHGQLTLTNEGLPAQWHDADTGWTVQFAYRDAQSRPFRISAHHPGGRSAIFLIKEVVRTEPFTEERLNLNIPQNSKIIAIPSTYNALPR